MIFTSTFLSRNQSTSPKFVEYGNPNQAPCPVSEAQISVLNVKHVPSRNIFAGFFASISAAFALEKPVSYNTGYKVSLSQLPGFSLVSRPPVAVTFPGTAKETIETKMNMHGYTKQAQNRFIYYSGPYTEASLTDIIRAGGDSECYSPYGACNIQGQIAFDLIQKILHGALRASQLFLSPPDLIEDYSGAMNDDITTFIPPNTVRSFTITSGRDAGEGHFFPYFDGLVLPDKTIINEFVSTFSYCLGTTPKEMAMTGKAMINGWSSLSTSPAGLVLSHIIFGVLSAIRGRTPCRLIYLGGNYAGFELCGRTTVVIKRSEHYTPTSMVQNQEDVVKFNRHDTNLEAICTILSASPLANGNDPMTITTNSLQSARALHYACRDRNIDAISQNKIRTLVEGLHYPQAYWNPLDDQKLSVAVEYILEKKYLNTDQPFFYRSVFLFSKEPIISTLGAFGVRAPSLCGPSPQTTVPIVSTGKMYENLANVKLRGIPVYLKALQQCYEDWTQVLSSGNIFFKTAAKGKDEFTRLPESKTFVPFDSNEGKKIKRDLASFIIRRKDGTKGKRKATDEESETSRSAKRKRLENVITGGEYLLGLANLAQIPTASTAEGEGGDTMDVDDMAF